MSKRTLSVPRPLIALALAGLSLAIPGRAGDSSAQTAAATPGQTAPKIPNEVVIVNRFGVCPGEITRPKGPFALVIRNGRGSREEPFTIVREGPGASVPLQLSAADKPKLLHYKIKAVK